MSAKTKISKWGNSLAVRIPLAVARESRLEEGDGISFEFAEDGSLVLRSAKPKYSLRELVSKITPENRHDEVDWGGPRGKEAW